MRHRDGSCGTARRPRREGRAVDVTRGRAGHCGSSASPSSRSRWPRERSGAAGAAVGTGTGTGAGPPPADRRHLARAVSHRHGLPAVWEGGGAGGSVAAR